MNMIPMLFTGREKIISLRDFARASKKSLAEGITRVIKGKESVGYFIPEDEVEVFLERTEMYKNSSQNSLYGRHPRISWQQNFEQADAVQKESLLDFSNTFDKEEWQW